MRRISLVGVFMLVMLALATHVTVAQADTNTITQTAITSPSDPSYFYDPTDGGVDPTTGATTGFTVTGTTDSTDPTGDAVDIDCYQDGSEYTVLPDVSVNSSGGFSAFVPYEFLEDEYVLGDPDASSCILRAVPAGSTPEDPSSFAGPRVLVAYLIKAYPYPGSNLADYLLVAPQLGATNVYTSVGDCGLAAAVLNDPSTFGQPDSETFGCADALGGDVNHVQPDPIQVDGADAYTPFGPPESYPVFEGNNDDSGLPQDSISITVSQNPSNGDMTVNEVDPLYTCEGDMDPYDGCDAAYRDTGVVEDRTIEQSNGGRVVEINDTFKSVDGNLHTVSIGVQNEQCFLDSGCDQLEYDNNDYDPTQVAYEFPGESGYSTHVPGDSVTVGSQSPASIYIENNGEADGSTAGAQGAITYFTPPSSGEFSFFQSLQYEFETPYVENMLLSDYQLAVPANGSAQLSYAYSSEFSESALSGDIQTARDLQAAPSVTITSPASGSSTSSASVTVAGQDSATTGVRSIAVNGVAATINGSSFSAKVPLTPGANTVTAVLTTNSGVSTSATKTITYNPPAGAAPAIKGWAGAVWLPIADTGNANRAGAVKENLKGKVTAGSDSVTYYFEYGTHGHLNHHSRDVALAAGNASRNVALTIGGLSHGTHYTYRLVADGADGHSAGASRKFTVAKSGN